MAADVPYHHFTGLREFGLDEFARELELNFDAVGRAIVPTPQAYDAFVDPSLTVDSIPNKTFKTPFAAIQYVADTLLKSNVVIGVKRTAFTGATATETGNYAGTNTVSVSMELIGPDTSADSRIGTGVNDWDLGTFTDNSKFFRVRLSKLRVKTAKTGAQSPFTSNSCKVYAEDCYFDGASGVSGTNAPAIPPGWFRDCTFLDVNFAPPSNTGDYYMLRCGFYSNLLATNTFSNSMYWWDSAFFGRTDNTSSIAINSQEFVAADCIWTVNSAWSGTGSALAGRSFNLTNAGSSSGIQRIYMTAIGETGTGNQCAEINFTVGCEVLQVEGRWWKLTISAPIPAAGVGSGRHNYVHATVTNTFDITGPAEIAVRSQQGANFLRGAGITGAVMAFGNLGTGTALSFVGVTGSTITAVLPGYSTGPGGKGYAIDAACANNVFVMEGASNYSVASTNLSATTLVIDHNGAPPTGPAGGDLTGTFPNPSLANFGPGAIGPIGDSTHVAAVTVDAKGRVSALTSIAISGTRAFAPEAFLFGGM